MKTNRNLWPLGVILSFVLFFGGMASVVVIASTHRENLVNANYYEQELKFQGQIDSAERTRKSGANITYNAADRSLIIALPAAQIAQKCSGVINLYRPSDPKLDRGFQLEPRADGTQTLNVSELAAGLWLVRAKWSAGGENFFLEQKITVANK